MGQFCRNYNKEILSINIAQTLSSSNFIFAILFICQLTIFTCLIETIQMLVSMVHILSRYLAKNLTF